MILNRTQQDSTRELLDLLAMTQKDLAAEIEYGTSALSEALRLSKPKPINEDKWERLVGVLEGKVASLRTSNPSAMLQAEQLLKSLSSGSDGPAIHAPGGKMPANAQNYVERQCDTLLFHSRVSNIADRPGNYPAVIVTGGIQSGRSSLMERLIAAATRKGHDFRSVDLRSFAPEVSRNASTGEIFRYVFEAFGLSDMPTEEKTHVWVGKFREFAAKLDRHTFFIVDSADFIIDQSPEAKVFNDLVRLLIGIRDARPQHTSIAVTYSARGWRYIHGSPYANAAFEVTTAPFTLEEVIELLRLLFEGEKGEDIERVADVLLKAFRGQPHLTHLAAFQLKNHPSKDTWEALRDVLHDAGLRRNAEQIEPEKTFDVAGAYRTHWERMRREIIGLRRQLKPEETRQGNREDVDHDAENRALGQLLRCVIESADKEASQLQVDESTTAFVTLFDRLKILGFLDGPLPGHLSPFYRAAILADPSLFRA